MEKCDISTIQFGKEPLVRTQYRALAFMLYALSVGLILLPYIRFGWITQSHIDAAAAVTPMALGIFFHILGRTTKGE